MVQFILNLGKTQTFSKKFYSELATDQVKKLPIVPNKFCSSTTQDYYAGIFNTKKQ